MKIYKALTVSFLNQFVSSGTNFILGIYLVRILSVIDFGLYGIGFSMVLFYSGLVNSLIITQMVVLVPDKSIEVRDGYVSRMFIALIVFSGFSASVIVLIATIIKLINVNIPIVYLLSVVAAAIFYVLKEFFVRYSYTVRRESWALWSNICTTCGLIVLLGGLRVSGLPANVNIVLWLFAISSLVGGLFGLMISRLPVLKTSMSGVVGDMQEAWSGGRWALSGTIIIWLQSQAYMYVTAIFLGPAGVGLANAARLLLAPAMFAVPAVTQLVMPRLADLRNKNINRMYSVGTKITIVLIVFSVLYSLVLIVFNKYLVKLFLGSKYDDIQILLLMWGLVLICQFSRVGTSTILQVVKEFKNLTIINFFCAVIAIITATIFMQRYGVEGAILGTAIGEFLLSIGLYRLLVKTKRGIVHAYTRENLV